METTTTRTLPDGLVLKSGAHKSINAGGCTMEWVAYLANEPHSDHPQCACPVLSAYVRRLNDARWSGDAARTEALAPWLPLLLNTRGARETERARAKWLANRALTHWAPVAMLHAITALEKRGRDCAEMRAAREALDAIRHGHVVLWQCGYCATPGCCECHVTEVSQ